MEMPKASDADKARFRSLVPKLPEVVVKPMFGNLGAFVNGNMFAGLFGPIIGVKLSERDKETPKVPSGQFLSERLLSERRRADGGRMGLPSAWSVKVARR